MKKNLYLATGSVALALFTPYASADFFSDMVFVPNASIGFKRVKLDEDFSRVRIGDQAGNLAGKTDNTFLNLNLGFTAASGPFYAAISLDQQLSTEEDDSDVPLTDSDTELERDDFTFTFGYNITDMISVFGGYKKGETTLTPDATTNPTNYAQVDREQTGNKYEQTYEEDGLFFGAGVAFPIGESGSISISAAYAFMDASYEDNVRFEPQFKFEGDTDGISVGGRYTFGLTESILLFADLKYQLYDFEGDDKTGAFVEQPFFEKVDVEEELTTLSFGINVLL